MTDAALLDVKARLDELKIILQEEEVIPIISDSEEEFLLFLNSVEFSKRPLIVVMDGYLRIFWRNKEEEQIGLKFLGNKLVEFILIIGSNKDIIKGMDILTNIKYQIEKHGLQHLM